MVPRLSDRELRELLRRLGSLGDEESPNEAREVLRKALAVKVPAVRARAAQAVQDGGVEGLTAELLQAYEEALDQGLKGDPGCQVKVAVLAALDFAEYEEAEPFLRGIDYVQIEGSGPQDDSAGGVRARSAFALVRLRHPEALSRLADLLADPLEGVRRAAAQALAYHGDPNSATLLRLRLHYPEPEPDVVLEMLKAYLQLDAVRALPLVEEVLGGSSEERRSAAALALGEARPPEALELLGDYVSRVVGQRELHVALLAIAGLRGEDSQAFLLELVAEAPAARALAAVEALHPYLFGEDERARALAAARRNPEAEVAVQAQRVLV